MKNLQQVSSLIKLKQNMENQIPTEPGHTSILTQKNGQM